MKKLYLYGLLLALLLLTLTGCAGSEAEPGAEVVENTPVVEADQPVAPDQDPAANPDQPVDSGEDTAPSPDPANDPQAQAVVETVEVLILESLPVQIHVLVKGYLPDACAQIEGHALEQQDNRININLNIAWAANQRCAPAPTPFEQTIPLAVADLTPGEYTVEVEGISESFILSAEMLAQPPAEEVEEQAGGVDQVKVYLVALEDKGASGPEIGCGDSLVAIDREVPPTKAPLTAAMNELLSLQDQYYGQSGFYNALYQSDLQVENITIDEQGTAMIYLAGTYALAGVCDGPRFEAQLIETARQFSTVKEVNIFINGKALKELLSVA